MVILNGGKTPLLIVDGYNIIGTWDELKTLKKSDMGSARDQLIAVLAAFCPWTWKRIIVVFDGQEFAWDHVDGVEIVFTENRETADTMIERLAAGLTASYTVEVATSDFAEYRAASSVGAAVLSADALRERLDEQRERYRRYLGTPQKKGLMLNNILAGSILDALEKMRRS
ncbi:MAG: NYN domain-containing protein [Bacillota bacterium]|nr:NYN domain-containing protein [Bacillota bacterium]